MKYQRIMVALAAAAFLGIAPTGAQAQFISDSPHDLSSGLEANADKNEVCVYCHTPHGADESTVTAPLWNKTIGTPVYTLYDASISSTLDGDVLTSVGGVSLACLSCHDGSQAVDAVINAPGTGLGTGFIGTAPNNAALTGVANIGGDSAQLSNDHPISIVYGGFDPGSGQIDPDFVVVQETSVGSNLWYVDAGGGPGDTRDKEDMILYTRLNTFDGGAPQPFVECGTCHDPHSGTSADTDLGGSNAPGSDVSFMRVANVSSDLCLSCHVK